MVIDTKDKQLFARGKVLGGGKKEVREIKRFKLPAAK